MKRIAQEWLSKWITHPHRKPMIIRGARQVGKSTLVRNFAIEHGLTLCEINLERHLYLDKVFQTLNMDMILKELEGIVKTSLLAPNSLLFLDEIQAAPAALAALRYFYEECPHVPVIAAGSLLEFTLNDHTFSMPVGRIEYSYLGPMNFTEFLLALGETYLVQELENYTLNQPWPESHHLQLSDHLRTYMSVGGMPEAVLAYTETRSIEEAQRVHRSILDTYSDDFAKYALGKETLLLIHHLFKFIPAHLGNRIKYVHLSSNHRSKEIKMALSLLKMATLVHLVEHTHAAGIPLDVQTVPSIFKCLFLDGGLANTLNGVDWTRLTRLPQTLITEGGVAEQFIGTHLLYRQHPAIKPLLHFWVRDGQTQNAEVDFVISEGSQVIPIEIKSGKSGRLRSLQLFSYLRKSPLTVRFDLNPPSIASFEHVLQTPEGSQSVAYRLLSLPLYMVTQLKRLTQT